jgi:hypothetical protein
LNRSTFALFVALLIHLLLLLIFWILGTITPDITKIKKPKEEKIKISLKEMPKKYKETGLTKKKVKKTPMAPPMPKGKQLKKLVKKPPIKFKPKKPVRTPTLNKPKPSKPKPRPKPRPKVEPLPPKEPYIPLIEKKVLKKPKKDNTPAWMLEDKAEKEVKVKKTQSSRFGSGGTTREMKELYGDKWGKLTPGQKQYMIDNQEIMRRITQRVLTRVAGVNLDSDLNINRTNVIEFYLHPNGDMTDFKFIKKSGYFVLDDTTKETIEYAYSQYPRPKEKILIRYNVFYNLARY